MVRARITELVTSIEPVDVREATLLKLEENKFKSVQWWTIRDIIKSPIKNFDPELHRLCNKLQAELARG